MGEQSVQPVPESETLLELLVQWEELRQQGKTADRIFMESLQPRETDLTRSAWQ